ncbi:hypothetical protein M513_03347 [Trichuris suis]|uniref:Uncharacterized protein n=1 Tax=Trichuris suis TaxID=68888 RepID=A0A085MFB2_9BILA|nr:hypothetical protein M513_03347 [Trichuris suis]
MWIEERRAGPRNSSLKSNVLKETIELQHDTNVRELAASSAVHYSTGSWHFPQIENPRKKRIAARLELLLREVEIRSLERSITWDERWCLYDNRKRRALNHDKHRPSKSLPKPNIHPMKHSFCLMITLDHLQRMKLQKCWRNSEIRHQPHPAHSADRSPNYCHFFRLANYTSTTKCTERWKDKNLFHPVVYISTNQTDSKDKRKNCNNIILKERTVTNLHTTDVSCQRRRGSTSVCACSDLLSGWVLSD